MTTRDAIFSVPAVLLEELRKAGIDLDKLFRDVGLPDYESCWQKLTWEELIGLFAASVRASDQCLPIRVGTMIRPEHFGVVGLLAMTSTTFGHALHNLARYKRLGADQELTIDESGGQTVVGLRFFEQAPAGVHYLVECEIAFLVSFGRWATRRVFSPAAVHVRHAMQSEVRDALVTATGAPVRCGRRRDEIVFPGEVLGYQLVSANQVASRALAGAAEGQLATRTHALTTRGRVQAVLRQKLRGASPSIEVIARCLGMSARTLQRRLRSEGTSYQEILDAVRKELAIEYIDEPTRHPGEIAFLLGFAHINSFLRAFRRWTGMTLGEYSRQRTPSNAVPGR